MSDHTIARLEARVRALTQENQELRADGNGLPFANMPVAYYPDGAIYAVYGSSSIDYVEKLRARLVTVRTLLQRPRTNPDIDVALSAWLMDTETLVHPHR